MKAIGSSRWVSPAALGALTISSQMALPGPFLGNVAVSRRTATFNRHLITFGLAPPFNCSNAECPKSDSPRP
jgi:hypothetical protein